MRGLEERVVLITGGGSGVGRAIVDRFLSDGARIVVLERDPDKVASLGEEIKHVAEQMSRQITVAYREGMRRNGVEA